MHYHESIIELIRVVGETGEDIDSASVVVRDAAGRLTFGRKQLHNGGALKARLVETLGGYASKLPVVEGLLAEKLLKDPSSRKKKIDIEGRLYEFTYVDRRVVGNDWLNKSSAIKDTLINKRVVFYSIKGGVGRSTALTVYAAYLAQKGKRVLVVDLDVEAPGLGAILLNASSDPTKDQRPKFGVIDYLLENSLVDMADSTLVDFIGTRSLPEGSIDVVPAIGRETDNNPSLFMEKLPRALTEDVSEGRVSSLSAQVDEMITALEKAGNYDIVLIDARAGFAEISAAALLGLRSNLVFFGVDQQQTFSGYRYLLSHLISQFPPRSNQSYDWRENLTFVQSKAPPTRRERLPFREKLYDICSELIYDVIDDETDMEAFSFSPSDTSIGAPHNCTYIRSDAAYSKFEPTSDLEQLDPELYTTAFKPFIERMDEILNITGA